MIKGNHKPGPLQKAQTSRTSRAKRRFNQLWSRYKIRPIACVGRVVEARLAVEVVEVSADELAVFHANAGIIDQIGHAAGGIDLIVGTAGSACFRFDGLDAVFERLLDDDDAREASVRRAVCDIEF